MRFRPRDGQGLGVALRKESVDRNRYLGIETDPLDVALRKESVDRNCWRCHNRLPSIPVALRKESVDRNHDDMLRYRDAESLSARRAWIEIAAGPAVGGSARVALRKESVDRNGVNDGARGFKVGRSPQGERG